MTIGWLEADISAVLGRYRAAGWSAMSGGRRALCVLSPLATATANQADEALQRALDESVTATIAQPDPAPAGETMIVGTGDAKGMPPGLVEELVGADHDAALLDGLRTFAVAHGEPAFGSLVAAAIKGETWATERIDDFHARVGSLQVDRLTPAGVELMIRAIRATDIVHPEPTIAEELAAMDPADRRIAERVATLGDEPPAGYEDRAVERARREGVLR